MKRLLLFAGLLACGCSPATSGSQPVPSTPTPVAVATPAATPVPHMGEEKEEEDEGPPLPLLKYRPDGDPHTGFEKAKAMPGYEQVKALGTNPVAWTYENVMEGQMLYRQHCANCHCWDGDGDGPQSVGMQPMPRNFSKLSDYKYGTGDLALFRTARHGIPGSPMTVAPPGVTDEQVWKIVHFVRTMQPAQEPREVIIDLSLRDSAAVRSGICVPGENTDTDTFAWSKGPSSRFTFRLAPKPGKHTLTIRARCSPALPKVDMTAVLNGREIGKIAWQKDMFFGSQTLSIPSGLLKNGENELILRYAQVAPLSPTDPRKSSLCLDYLQVAPDSKP